jgi:hypothetical protein
VVEVVAVVEVDEGAEVGGGEAEEEEAVEVEVEATVESTVEEDTEEVAVEVEGGGRSLLGTVESDVDEGMLVRASVPVAAACVVVTDTVLIVVLGKREVNDAAEVEGAGDVVEEVEDEVAL